MVSGRQLHEVVLRGRTVSSIVAHGTAVSKAQAGTGVGRRTVIDRDLMLLLCARAAKAFSKSSQNRAEISLNKAIPGQGFSKRPGITDKRWFNRVG